MQNPTHAERLYRQSQEAILELVTEENKLLPVPATPGWDLRDVVAHLTGALIDLITGNTRHAPSPAWTAGHVERFSQRDLFEIAFLWRDAIQWESAELFERLGVRFLPDIVTHEFDVRGALGNTEDRDEERVHVAFAGLAAFVDRAWRESGIPAVELVTGQDRIVIGDGDPRATARGTAFELSRVLTGRRSPAQVRALDWSADPSPWLEHLSALGGRDDDLVE